MVPRNPNQFLPSNKLGFSTFLSRGPSVSRRISLCRASGKPIGWNLGFSSEAVKGDFVVRAESDEAQASETVEEKEGDVVEAEANAKDETEGVVTEEEAEGESEAEVKEPRKPPTKLGDIMGVIKCIDSSYFLCLFCCLA